MRAELEDGGHTYAGRRRSAVALEMLLFIGVLGLPDGALGVLWPSLRADFDRPVGDLGVLVVAGALPYLAGSSVTGWAMSRLGTARLLGGASILAAAALTSWLLAPAWGLIVGAMALFGLARGAVDAGVNAHAALTRGVRRLGLLHAAYGMGATAGPLIAAPLVVHGPGWRAVIGGLAAIAVVAAAGARLYRAAWSAPAAAPADGHGPAVAARATRGFPLLAGTLLLFFAYTSVEGAAGTWAYTFLTEARGVQGVAAGLVAAGYWGCLTGGRLGVAVLGGRVSPRRLLDRSVALTVLGFAVLWQDPGGLGAVGLPLAGLGLAAVFPVLIAVTPDRFGPARTAVIIGWSTAAAAVGGPVFVWVTGQVVERRGLASIPPLIATAALVLGALHLAVDRWAEHQRATRPDGA